MSMLQPRGSMNSQVWVVVNDPYKGDVDSKKGWIFSGGYGYLFDKMMKDAGFDDYCVVARRPDRDYPNGYANILGELEVYKPPIIIPLENAAAFFLPQLVPKRQGKDYNPDEDSEISKYCGSLLTCDKLSYPHYMLPTYAPDTISRQWGERDIVVSCDLGKARAELDYFRKHGHLRSLPQRKCQIDFSDFGELLSVIRNFEHYDLISNDIETIYPRDKSVWKGLHPGYPITIGLASSASFGISFELFRNNPVETRELWRALNKLFIKTQQLGQNFFNFDLNFYKMLGFEIDPKRCTDTMIRHAVLWPEMKHKLQFLTRQYTREPYYKDEGHGWSVKDMRGLKHYNCLDVCVTFEVYEEQELEFDARPHLR